MHTRFRQAPPLMTSADTTLTPNRTCRRRSEPTIQFLAFLRLPLVLAFLLMACETPDKPIPSPAPHLPPPELRRPPTEVTADVATWREGRSGAASLTFDDGTLDHYLVAVPILEHLDVSATFFLMPDLIDDGVWPDGNVERRLISWTHAQKLLEAGHEVGSHTATHADLTTSEADLEDELVESRRRLEGLLEGARVTTLAWPYWRKTEAARRIAMETYVAARGGAGVPRLFEQIGGVPEPDSQNLDAINSMGVRGGAPQTVWQTYIEQAEAGGWAVLALHGIDDGKVPDEALGWDPIKVYELEKLVKTLQERDLWIAPFGVVADYLKRRRQTEVHLAQPAHRKTELALRSSGRYPATDNPAPALPEEPQFRKPLTVRIRHAQDYRPVEVREARSGRPIEWETRGEWILIDYPLEHSALHILWPVASRQPSRVIDGPTGTP